MMAIIDATLATEADSRFTLIYGNRSSHSMMFRQALADLKDRYPQRLQVVHLFSQESMDSDLLQGRIDGDKLRAGRPSAGFQPLRRGLYLRPGGDDG
jgi:ring-1,2-phenylacetyl-CoA epoxidase subunit PaaE